MKYIQSVMNAVDTVPEKLSILRQLYSHVLCILLLCLPTHGSLLAYIRLVGKFNQLYIHVSDSDMGVRIKRSLHERSISTICRWIPLTCIVPDQEKICKCIATAFGMSFDQACGWMVDLITDIHIKPFDMLPWTSGIKWNSDRYMGNKYLMGRYGQCKILYEILCEIHTRYVQCIADTLHSRINFLQFQCILNLSSELHEPLHDLGRHIYTHIECGTVPQDYILLDEKIIDYRIYGSECINKLFRNRLFLCDLS